MRTLYILSLALLLACGSLWLGKLEKIKKLPALVLALIFLAMGGGFLTASVLPGDLIYGATVTNLQNKSLSQKEAKSIALTFDDGPYEPYTSLLLEQLKEKNVQATFFIIAEQAEKHPEVLQKIVAAGHTLGLHQYKHVDSLKLSSAELKESLTKGKDLLEKISGKKVKFYRPCHGFRDGVTLSVAKDLGLTVVNWDTIPRDWTLIGADEITRRVVNDARTGSIILLHDGDSPTYTHPRMETVKAVPKIIDELRAQGYTFVKLE